MHYLIAAIYFLFALFGWDGWGAQTIATHAFDHGTEVLYSEASVTPVLARFSCVSSATGECHYRFFSAHCDQPMHTASVPACQRKPYHELVVATGNRTELARLPANFTFCVNQDALPPDVPCRPELRAGLAQ
ncbi:MAG: hypothetical protein ABI767_12010 [Rhodanobacter sp.]